MGKVAVLHCPACGGGVEATRLHCAGCDVTIEGRFATSPFARLTAQQQEFVQTFLATRGNIKLMEARLGVSYPTVRSRLDAVRKALGLPDLAAGEEGDSGPERDVRGVLDRLESGEVSADEAIDLLG